MSEKDEYGRGMWEYYDALFTGSADVEFYVAEAKRARGRVLELGCGTGRVTVPIAQAGVDITGLDVSEEMLSVARKKKQALPADVADRLAFVRDDMETFSLDRKYELAIIPFRSFLHMPTPEAERNALSNIGRHLVPGGRLILNVFDPSIPVMSGHVGSNKNTLKKIKELAFGEGTLIVWETCAYDLEAQTVTCSRIFEEFDRGGESRRRTRAEVRLRYVHRYEMQYLAELCGYRIVGLYGEFQRGPFRHGGEQIWELEWAGVPIVE